MDEKLVSVARISDMHDFRVAVVRDFKTIESLKELSMLLWSRRKFHRDRCVTYIGNTSKSYFRMHYSRLRRNEQIGFMDMYEAKAHLVDKRIQHMDYRLEASEVEKKVQKDLEDTRRYKNTADWAIAVLIIGVPICLILL